MQRISSISRKLRNWSDFRIFLNGVDISNDCFEADDKLMYALVYSRDESGKKYVVCSSGQLAIEMQRGDVQILPRGETPIMVQVSCDDKEPCGFVHRQVIGD